MRVMGTRWSLSRRQARVHRFDVHPVRKECLLEGLDDIARTREYAERFALFEDACRAERPWLCAESP